MKIKPILFSTEMVQAIQKGTKTQTRRIIKNDVLQNMSCLRYDGIEEDSESENYQHHYVELVTKEGEPTELYSSIGKCPFGNIGDVLWVRETFSKNDSKIIYRADVCSKWDLPDGMKWKPSIFMPKEATRIFLKVVNVRVEKLFDISEDDAKSEGVTFKVINGIEEYTDYVNPKHTFPVYAKLSFISLWEKINGSKSLEENPFVWVIEFDKTEKPENF